MTKPTATNEPRPEELSEQELDEASGEPLPDREAMSVIRGVEPFPHPIVPVPPTDSE